MTVQRQNPETARESEGDDWSRVNMSTGHMSTGHWPTRPTRPTGPVLTNSLKRTGTGKGYDKK